MNVCATRLNRVQDIPTANLNELDLSERCKNATFTCGLRLLKQESLTIHWIYVGSIFGDPRCVTPIARCCWN